MTPKALLRQEMLARLGQINPSEAAEAARRVAEQVIALPEWQAAASVLLYAARNDELDLRPLWKLGAGKTLLAPRMDSHEPPRLIAIEAPTPPPTGSNETNHWHRVRYDIWEPTGLPHPIDQIDLVLVPGVAFTADGRRLGRGKGYYDRFLPLFDRKIPRFGIAYDLQKIDNLPTEAHDVPLDGLITPSVVYRRTDSQTGT